MQGVPKPLRLNVMIYGFLGPDAKLPRDLSQPWNPEDLSMTMCLFAVFSCRVQQLLYSQVPQSLPALSFAACSKSAVVQTLYLGNLLWEAMLIGA